MRTFVAVMVVVTGLIGAPASGMVSGIFQSTVHPGEDVYFLFPKGDGGTSNPSLPSGWTFSQPAKYSVGDNWHIQWAWKIHVPSNARAGNYSISTPSDGARTVTVLAMPKSRSTVYITRERFAGIQNVLAAGSDIELAPGIYTVSKPIPLPDGCKIRSHGAELRRTSDGTSYQQRMFVPAGGFTLDGLTLSHDETIDDGGEVYIHNDGAHSGNVKITNCVIRDGALMQYYPASGGVIVSKNEFRRGCTGQIGSQTVYFDNDFYGHTNYGNHSFFTTGAVGSLMISNRWHGTNRGIVIQTGDTRGCVFMDMSMDGIRGGQANANECILMEAGTNGEIVPDSTHGIRDNAFIDAWINNCAGPGVSLYGSGMHGNVFFNIDLHTDNTSISLAAQNGGVIGANDFENIEATGCLLLVGDVGGQSFSNVIFIEMPQLHGNQGASPAVIAAFNARGAYPINVDVVARAQSYKFSGVNFLDRDHTMQAITSVHFIRH